MTIENLKHKWHKNFNKAINTIEGCLTPDSKDEDSVNFSILANWLIDNQYSPYDYMQSGYHDYRSNPFETESLLSTLHHALVDDGDVSFVKMKVEGEIKRIFMIFACRHEDYFRTICLKENASDIQNSIDMRQKMHSFIKDKPLLSEDDFSFEAHRDPILFIKEVEEFQLQKQQEREKSQEFIKSFKLKP